MPKNHKNWARLFIVRHGESEANVRFVWGGDTPLTEKGREQALERSKKLAPVSFTAIYSSDLVRTIQTAEIIRAERDIAIQAIDVLRERHFGSLEGLAHQDLEKQLQKDIEASLQLPEKERWKHEIALGAETMTDSTTRFITYIRQIAIAHPNQDILITSHGSLMRTFLVKVLGLSLDDFPMGSVSNTALIEVWSDGIEFEVKQTDGITFTKTE